MRKYLFILAFVIGCVQLHAQSAYQVNNNRVVLSTIVNADTVIVESLKNQVAINGELDLIKVEYNNRDARVVGRIDQGEERSDIVIRFFNEYSWLDERIKMSENVMQFTDEIKVDVHGVETTVPVDFTINRIRGGQGFTVLIQITGNFSAKDLEEDFPHLNFQSDIMFGIYLTVQVVN